MCDPGCTGVTCGNGGTTTQESADLRKQLGQRNCGSEQHRQAENVSAKRRLACIVRERFFLVRERIF